MARVTDPFVRAMAWGVLAFLAILLAALAWPARAEGPPPVVALRPVVRASPPVSRPWCEEPERAPVDPPSYRAVLLAEPATEAERTRIAFALDACAGLRGGVERVADPWDLLALLRVEAELGAPAGLLVATFCVEVAMRSHGRHDGRHLGDWRDGTPRASGPFQLHENVWGGTCRGTPDAPHDLLWAARCYWTEVLRVAEIGRRKAPDCAEPLRVAEAAAANVRRYGWRCDSRSAHWGMMEAMR